MNSLFPFVLNFLTPFVLLAFFHRLIRAVKPIGLP